MTEVRHNWQFDQALSKFAIKALMKMMKASSTRTN